MESARAAHVEKLAALNARHAAELAALEAECGELARGIARLHQGLVALSLCTADHPLLAEGESVIKC
jgi:hypothetical protein